VSEQLLEINDLVVRYGGRRGGKTVIHDVSLGLAAGETVSLVGESGSGKTTIGRAILGLAPVTEGTIRFRGQEIGNISRSRRRQVARDIQVIFQDPYSSLNPSMTIESILVEPLRAAGVAEGRTRVRELLDAVGLPADAGSRYPREFSGGQRQRIAIARALALQPSVIVCDEPTSALDVTTQARVLTLLDELQKATGVAYLFISHDLIVEVGDAHQVATDPQHPYTRRLQMSAPIADPPRQRARRAERLRLFGTATPPETTDPTDAAA
jgi:peptide/nickel transport system ATP-binding protein